MLSCWHQYLDECPPDRGRNPRCFNGLPYRCGFPQIKIVCQQIRGCFSTPRPAASPALGGLIHKLTNALWGERGSRSFAARADADVTLGRGPRGV